MNPSREAQQITTLASYALLALTAFLAYRVVQPFLVEIGWAVVFAICLARAQERVSRHLGARRSALLLTFLVLLVLILPLLIVARVLVGEGADAVRYIDAHVTDRGGPMGLFRIVWDWLHQRMPFLPSEEE